MGKATPSFDFGAPSRSGARSAPLYTPSWADPNAKKRCAVPARPQTTPSERNRRPPPSESPHIIVLGGCDHENNILESVEGYNGRGWIELPSLNTPRHSHSSVLFGNQIVVSGGETAHGRTDTIEIFNLRESPRRWITSSARLPVPLRAHQTVVHRGKLIVIGGNGTAENSNKIYEVELTPPYSTRNLCSLPQPMSWHGAEMVGGKIYIFGREEGFPHNKVFVYNPSDDTCVPAIAFLPSPFQKMATVFRGNNEVMLLGGVGADGYERDNVISYDILTGQTKNLRRMMQRRGGCSAVIYSNGTAGEMIVVALGSLRNLGTVESSPLGPLGSNSWSCMPRTNVARKYCTAVVAHIAI